MPVCRKMPLPSPRADQRGQILPLGLALLLSACLGMFLLISLGRILVARERHRMQADLTAHAGAIDLARSLNITAMINKIQAAILAVDLASVAGTSSAWNAHRALCALVDRAYLAAPYLPEATVLYVGSQNQLKAVPVWSKGASGDPSALPTLNLERRYLIGGLESALTSLMGNGSSSDSSNSLPDASASGPPAKYTYVRKQDGQEVTVDSSEVQQVIFKEHGKIRTESRKRDPITGKVKFVKENSTADPFPLDIVETGPHRVTVIGWADNQDQFDSALLPRPPAQTVIASAEAGGGDTSASALDPNADFDAYLISVERGLELGSDYQRALNIAHWLRSVGVSLPEEVEGWALIAH
jgi:hypothetical protein